MRAQLLFLLAPFALAACIEPAGDIGSCDGLPSCPAGSIEVAECPQDASCSTESMCGRSILCQAEEDNCLAAPTCPEGSVQVEACPQDASCSTESVCGTSILCMDAPDDCAAYPAVCPGGTEEVEVCPQDSSCDSVSNCGHTILCSDMACMPDFDCPDDMHRVGGCQTDACLEQTICGLTFYCDQLCDAIPPECPVGQRAVEHCQEVGPSCTRHENCGGQTWCVPDVQCFAAPTCPEGSWGVALCPPDASCFESIACGEVLLCTDDDGVDVCDAVPVCADGMREVPFCPTEHPACDTAEMCGSRIYCMADMDCDAAAMCPAGFERVERCEASDAQACEWVLECGEALLCAGPR